MQLQRPSLPQLEGRGPVADLQGLLRQVEEGRISPSEALRALRTHSLGEGRRLRALPGVRQAGGEARQQGGASERKGSTPQAPGLHREQGAGGGGAGSLPAGAGAGRTALRAARPPATAAGVRPSPERREEPQLETLQQVLEEMDSLVGLHKVKRLVREVRAFVEIQRRRAQEQLVSEPVTLHMVFRGNPGTGKTTVARILGKMFHHMQVLPKGHLVEVERADLVGEYIGHTAQKTREQVRRATGGVLFVDEAYSLARGGEKDFGKESIDVLVKAMEDLRDQFVLVLAGYPREMDHFLQVNPGLRSRFPIHIDFPDYTVDELLQIAEMMLRQREYRFSPEARERLRRILAGHVNNPFEENFGNARLVRNLIERAIRRQALRLLEQGRFSRNDLVLIRQEDLVDLEDPEDVGDGKAL